MTPEMLASVSAAGGKASGGQSALGSVTNSTASAQAAAAGPRDPYAGVDKSFIRKCGIRRSSEKVLGDQKRLALACEAALVVAK